MKQEIITKLENLLEHEDINTVSTQIKTIQREYEEAFSKEIEKAKEDFSNDGGRSRDFIYTKSKEDEKIVELFDKFRKLKKQSSDKLQTEQEKNLGIKTNIIRDIGDLSKMDVNVSGAIKKLHELQLKYKETGNVPAAKHKDVLTDYNKVVDTFYFGLNLYKESQEVDLKKNFEAKTLLLERMKNLLALENIKDVERNIKVVRNEWVALGAIPQGKWASIREEFKSLNEQVNKKIQDFYGEKKEQLTQNLELKKQLIEKAKALIATTLLNEKEWEQTTKALIDIQNEYKKVGHTEQNAGDEVWKTFREICDEFFNKKKERYEQAKQKKLKLIEEAAALKESTDWQKTGEKIMNLQQQWKRLPGTYPKDEHKMYEQFRAVCNHFFEAKRMQFAQQNAELENNIQHKETIIQNLHGFAPSGNAQDDANALKEFTKQWQASGQAPASERKRLNDAFYNKLEELFGTISGDETEKGLIKYKLKLERLEVSENGHELLIRENDFIRKQINEIQQQANVYENNMGFFKNAKTKNQMMIDLENKIAAEKAKIDELKKKQKLVRELLDKAAKPA
ncbi:MAG TPA: DUF349 domain-containing protein [Bacteroidia bacterium]